MSAPYIQITELPIAAKMMNEAEYAWRLLLQSEGGDVKLYRQDDGSTLLELRAFQAWPDLECSARLRQEQWDTLAKYAAGDFRREILSKVDDPKPTEGGLPDERFLELRYVEVLPDRYEEYRTWREQTIFDVVRGAPEVISFSAYHSVFTTHPGVVFLSGFDGSLEDYRAVFATPRYKTIVSEAAERYITGGEQGLSTRTYVFTGDGKE
ncbi:hypothetical protein [Actinomyces ruminicola]|uniref:hypothetical protein n=1 Tax=Actinomyces ruminicola TaxID=332524 RepID=UPI000B872721|nr:hypothetical protein [Actinomyces ruminicola]